MARPRIFVSSTFFDLHQVRADLEQFILQMGYDPVLHEYGHVPYGSKEALEQYCYREIQNCDILVSIIGGRFGSSSQNQQYSISQMELKHARKLNKQVHVFVQRTVYYEFNTFKKNRGNESIQFSYVDDARIFEFIDEVSAYAQNNAMAPFETSQDIVQYLREQWAGMFQALLRDESRRGDFELIEKMNNTAQTLDRLVAFLADERKNSDSAIRDILMTSHPVFSSLREVTKTPYRLFFTNISEMNDWLAARRWTPVDEIFWADNNFMEWSVESDNYQSTLYVSREIFDADGRLRVMTADEWNDEWVSVKTAPVRQTRKQPVDDEIPF